MFKFSYTYWTSNFLITLILFLISTWIIKIMIAFSKLTLGFFLKERNHLNPQNNKFWFFLWLRKSIDYYITYLISFYQYAMNFNWYVVRNFLTCLSLIHSRNDNTFKNIVLTHKILNKLKQCISHERSCVLFYENGRNNDCIL